MRYILITGMNAATEALQTLITSDVIGAGFDQPGLIGDIIGKLALLLDAYDIAGFFLDGFTDQFYQALCFSASLQTHENADHGNPSKTIVFG